MLVTGNVRISAVFMIDPGDAARVNSGVSPAVIIVYWFIVRKTNTIQKIPGYFTCQNICA